MKLKIASCRPANPKLPEGLPVVLIYTPSDEREDDCDARIYRAQVPSPGSEPLIILEHPRLYANEVNRQPEETTLYVHGFEYIDGTNHYHHYQIGLTA